MESQENTWRVKKTKINVRTTRPCYENENNSVNWVYRVAEDAEIVALVVDVVDGNVALFLHGKPASRARTHDENE